MKKEVNLKFIAVIILVIIGLTPLLWFKGGLLIDGADIDFSLMPIREFMSRAQTWDGVYQGGRNNVLNLATLVFSGIQAGFYLITRSLIWTEKLSFVFWFMFSLFSIYALVDLLILRGRRFLLKLVPCLFYQFNFYQLVCWAEVHIAGITALAVLPVLFLLFIKILEGKGVIKYIVLFSIFSVFSAGIWVNPPTAIVFALIFLSYFIFRLFGLIKTHDWQGAGVSISRVLLLVVLYGLLNAYVLVPFIDTLFLNISGTSCSLLKDYNIFGNLKFQSEYSSPLNVIRLMGRADLYATWKRGEYYYPFFVKYMVNRWLVLGSFILPGLAFLGAVLNRGNRFTRYFLGLAVAGVILGIGIHFPMKEVYKWMVLHIPLFYLFRQPWLKFGLFTAFGYPVLAGLCLDRLYKYAKKAKIPAGGILVFGIMGVYLIFMHSFIFGEMYTPAEKRNDLNPMHIRIPDYVFSASQWINEREGSFTVVPLPEEKSNVYKWGYRGITDVLVKVTDKKILYQEWGEMGEAPFLAQLYRLFARGLYSELTRNISYLLNLMDVRYIIQRNDIKYYFYGGRESPAFVKEKLHKQNGISYQRSFGQWDVYLNEGWRGDFISPATSLIWVRGTRASLVPLSELKFGEGAFSEESVFLLDAGDRLPEKVEVLCFNTGFKLLVNPSEWMFKEKLSGWGSAGGGVLFYSREDKDTPVGRRKNIWFPRSGIYRVFVKLKTKFKKLILEEKGGVVFNPSDILEWDYRANNTEYESEVSSEVLIIDTMFNGDSREDEYVRLRKEGLSIDVEKYPWFVMDYKVESPRIQTLEIILGLDFNDDGEVDGYLRGFHTIFPMALYSKFRINVMEKLIYRFPRETKYKVVLVELYPHKLWEADCSRKGLKGDYRFWIKGVKFVRMEEKKGIEVFNYKLNYKEKDVRIEQGEETDKSMKVFISLPEYSPVLFQEIELDYRFRYPSGVRAADLFLHLRQKDGKGKEEVLFIAKFPVVHKYAKYRINVLNYTDKIGFFKGKVVTGIGLKFYGKKMRKDIEDILRIRRLKVFKSLFSTGWQGLGQDGCVTELGGKRIYVPYIKENGRVPDEIIIPEELYMEKGWNRLQIALDEDDFLQCQWICILPPERLDKQELPRLEYRKINETSYRVKVRGGNGPFILVMKNNYDPKWRAYVVQKTEDRRQKTERKKIVEHFEADGFANAWFVKGADEDTEVLIRYYPQSLFRVGLWFSLLTGIGVFGVFLSRRISR